MTITIGWPEAVLMVIGYGTAHFITSFVMSLLKLRARARRVSSGDPAPRTQIGRAHV